MNIGLNEGYSISATAVPLTLGNAIARLATELHIQKRVPMLDGLDEEPRRLLMAISHLNPYRASGLQNLEELEEGIVAIVNSVRDTSPEDALMAALRAVVKARGSIGPRDASARSYFSPGYHMPSLFTARIEETSCWSRLVARWKKALG